MVHKSAAKTRTRRRMARGSQPAKLLGTWFGDPIHCPARHFAALSRVRAPAVKTAQKGPTYDGF